MRRLLLLLALALAACDSPPPQSHKVYPVALRQNPPHHPAVSNRLGIAVRAAQPAGVSVVAIEVDGPAGEAGLQIGDVILKVNGEPVANEVDLVRLADVAGQGNKLSLEVSRDGVPRQVAVRVGEGEGPNVLGLRVRELPKTALRVLGLPYGLMVLRVDPPADRSRILPGDIIVGVNQSKIGSLEEFNRILSGIHEAAVGLLVRRGASDLYVPIETGAAAGGKPGLKPARPGPAIDTPLRT